MSIECVFLATRIAKAIVRSQPIGDFPLSIETRINNERERYEKEEEMRAHI
jgi:predicted transcriptional regulator